MKTTPAALLLTAVTLVLLALASLTVGYESGSGTSGETSSTPPNTSIPPERGVLELSGALNINVSGNCVASITRYDLTIIEGKGNVTIHAILPNPCYKIEVNSTQEGVVKVNVEPPPRDQVCPAVLNPVSVTAPVTVPSSGQLRIDVYCDNVFETSVTINVSH